MGRAVQLPSGKWVDPGSRDDTRSRGGSGGSSGGGSTYVSKAKETKGQEFYTGTRIPTSITITADSSSSQLAQQYGLDATQQSQVSAAIVKARATQTGIVELANAKAQKEKTWQESQTHKQFIGDVNAGHVGVDQGGNFVSINPDFKPTQRATKGFDSDSNFKQDMMQSTLRRGAKMTTIYEPRDVSQQEGKVIDLFNKTKNVGLYDRLDIGFGGRLPGGLTPKEVKSLKSETYNVLDTGLGGFLPGGVSSKTAQQVYAKEMLLATPKESKQLQLRSRILAGTKAGAVTTGVAMTGGFALVSGAAIVAHPVVTAAVLVPVLGAGAATYYAGEGIRKVGSLRYSKEFKDILGDKTKMKQVREGIDVGLKGVKATQKPFSDPGVYSNVADYASFNLPFFKRDEGASGGRSKTFEFKAREYFTNQGYSGRELDAMVAVAQSERVGKRASYTGAFIGAGIGSEYVGAKLVGKYTAGIGTKAMSTIAGKVKFVKAATKGIAQAGFGEGATIKTLGYLSGEDKTYKEMGSVLGMPVPRVVYDNPLTWGAGGAISAGVIGGKIVQLSVAGKPIGSKGLLYGAYATDLGEGISDKLTDFGRFMYTKTTRRAASGLGKSGKVSVGVMTSVFDATTSGKKGSKTSIINTKSKISSNVLNDVISSKKKVSTRVGSSYDVTVPNIFNVVRTTSKVNVPRSRTPINIISPVSPIVKVPSIINVPAIVPTPVTITPPVTQPISIYTPVDTPVLTPVNTPVTVDTPVTVPTFNFKLPFVLPPGGSGRGPPRYRR